MSTMWRNCPAESTITDSSTEFCPLESMITDETLFQHQRKASQYPESVFRREFPAIDNFSPVKCPTSRTVQIPDVAYIVASPWIMENSRSRSRYLPALHDDTLPIATISPEDQEAANKLFQQLLLYLTPGMMVVLRGFSTQLPLNGAIVKVADPAVLNEARSSAKGPRFRIHIEPLEEGDVATGAWPPSRFPDVRYPRDVDISSIAYIARDSDFIKLLDRQLNDLQGEIPKRITGQRFTYDMKRRLYNLQDKKLARNRALSASTSSGSNSHEKKLARNRALSSPISSGSNSPDENGGGYF